MYTCDFCMDVLRGQEFSVRAYQYTGLEVTTKLWHRLCSHCYGQIRAAVNQAQTKIRQRKLQELGDYYTKLLQPAVEK